MKTLSILLGLLLSLDVKAQQNLGRNILIGGSDGIGWTEGVCYHPIRRVTTGDTLVFEFGGHDVYQLTSRQAFDDCDFSDAVLHAEVGMSPYEYTITENDVVDGTIYFACSVGDHCAGGTQKVMIQVEPNLGQSLQLESELSTDGASTTAVSQVSFGVSAEACAEIQDNSTGGDTNGAGAAMDSDCTEPELGDDGYYYLSCLSPPATLTPGGVINNLFIMHYPYPKDRRVLVGLRTWEFVMDDPDVPGSVSAVPINQLYIHHLSGRVVLGQGTEGVRRSEPDAPYNPPYGVVTGDEGDNMVFHIIDLREVDDWLPCIECRCKNPEDGTYLDVGGGGDGGFVDFATNGTSISNITTNPDTLTGGVSCCFNCTDLAGPTVDYRMRYNVSYTNITDENPVQNLLMLTADISPVVGKVIEFDVPAYTALDEVFQKPDDEEVQRLVREMPFNELFQHEFFGESYHGPETVRLFRCVAHLHVASMGMWLEDAETGESLCAGEVVYGTDPTQDKGLLKAVHVDNYDEPVEFPADRMVRLITEYNATEVHTGVMGMYFIFIDSEQILFEEDAALSIDLCLENSCDTGMLPLLTLAEIESAGNECEDTLSESPACRFGGLCDCSMLIGEVERSGCGGLYTTPEGSIEVNSVCAKSCGCPTAVTTGSSCTDALPESPACSFGGLCECEAFVNHPDSTGCDGVFSSQMGDIQVNDMCANYCDACTDMSVEEMLVEEYVKQLEEDLAGKCKYSTDECRRALKNAYSCSMEAPGIESFDVDSDEDNQALRRATVAHAGRLAQKYSQLGAPSIHRGENSDAAMDIVSCDELGDENKTDTNDGDATNGGGEDAIDGDSSSAFSKPFLFHATIMVTLALCVAGL